MTDVKRSWDNLIAELRHIRERGAVDADYFMTIRGLFEKIPELVLYDDSPSGISLVHYTTWKNALDMFCADHENPVLRMYNYEQSNDPDEGQIRPPEWEEVEREANWLEEFMKDDSRWAEDMKFGGSTYGCSFSSGLSDVEDDLTYWRLYGNNGQGCSLKISPIDGAHVYKVRYREKNSDTRIDHNDRKEDEQVAERLRKLFEAGKEIVDCAPDSHRNIVGRTVAEGLRQVIYGYYHLIKHIDYKDEKEWRMIRVMPRLDTIRYDTASENLVKRYIEGPAFRQLLSSASAITIGPAVLNRGAARAYFEHLARGHGMDYAIVKNSDKIYRQVSSPKPAPPASRRV